MSQNELYYAEISILVDGWPWNLSEFDFRIWFEESRCPAHLQPIDTNIKSEPIKAARRVSGKRKPQRKIDRLERKRKRQLQRARARELLHDKSRGQNKKAA